MHMLLLGAAATTACAAVVVPRLSAGGNPAELGASPMPPNPTTIDVVALRPVYLPGISDKDTADIAGDIFFWLKDRILHPMHCRRSPSWNQCSSGPLLYNDNVYTWSLATCSVAGLVLRAAVGLSRQNSFG
jgi:hypothetical protein